MRPGRGAPALDDTSAPPDASARSARSARSAVPTPRTLPQVDLLPVEIRTARTVGAARRWFLVGVGVTGLAVAAATGTAQVVLHHAQDDLTRAEAEAAGLVEERSTFADVTRLRAELATMRSARLYALGGEVLWSDLLGAIVAATPAGVGLSSIDYTGATPQAGVQPSGDPLVRTGVGTLAFTARAVDLPDTAAWVDALEAIPGLRDVRVASTAMADRGGPFAYQLTGTIQVDEAALAHRFDPRPGSGSGS